MEANVGKVVCEVRKNGTDYLKVVTTAPNTDPGVFVRDNVPGVGKPFWYWPSIPAGAPTSCDFTGAPIVSSDAAANNAAIAAITVRPEDVLTY